MPPQVFRMRVIGCRRLCIAQPLVHARSRIEALRRLWFAQDRPVERHQRLAITRHRRQRDTKRQRATIIAGNAQLHQFAQM